MLDKVELFPAMAICLRKQCPANELGMFAIIPISGSGSGSMKGLGLLSSCPVCFTGQLGTLDPMSLSDCWAVEGAVATLLSLMALQKQVTLSRGTVGLRQIGQGLGSQKREGEGPFSGGRE